MTQPVLHTDRLTLRPFTLEDVPEVARLVGDQRVAEYTANIAHPYSEDDARSWIETHEERFEKGELVNAAITDRADGTLVGAVGIGLHPPHARGELGYWIGVPFWNRGYASEAARELVRYAFDAHDLNRVYAMHLAHNPASGRVLEKIGMKREGTLREHWKLRFEKGYSDIEYYGVLRGEFLSS